MTAYKLMLLGEIGVGKSSIARRLVFQRFEADYKPTIGVDVFRYTLVPTPAGQAVTLIIWDTDGNYGGSIFQHVYLRQADGALVVADASRRSTIDTMRSLATGFLDARPGRYCGLILNKSDLVSERESDALTAEVADIGLPLIVSSAKTGLNVIHAFEHAAAAITRRNR
jgi:small GTP-binding protein